MQDGGVFAYLSMLDADRSVRAYARGVEGERSTRIEKTVALFGRFEFVWDNALGEARGKCSKTSWDVTLFIVQTRRHIYIRAEIAFYIVT